ncbi:60S acidic ribosomal protein P1-alpha 3 [Bulinus truncatus]|nr:60S acidic ribosomal protein P1-alpha 3 [Bulinus truncatus]
MSLNDHIHYRFNGTQLQSFQGKNVCLLGLAKNVDKSGKSFSLTTSDKIDIQIQLQEPLIEPVSGLIEVQGRITSRNSLLCDNVVSFPADAQNLDFSLYQKAVEFIQRCPNLYIQGGSAED